MTISPRRSTTAHHSARRDRGFRPGCEAVETRLALSGAPTVALEYGVVVIRSAGGIRETTARVSTLANQVTVRVNDSTYRFDASAVYHLNFDAGATTAGSVQTFTNDTAIGSFALGGGGLNRFTAGAGGDTFVGGSGVNEFQARDGFVFFIGSGEGTNDFRAGTGWGLMFLIGDDNRVSDASPNYYVVQF